jgi:hypothetical protein
MKEIGLRCGGEKVFDDELRAVSGRPKFLCSGPRRRLSHTATDVFQWYVHVNAIMKFLVL